MFFRIFFQLIYLVILQSILNSQIVQLGSGSYTTSFPGTDTAGRNGYPSGAPQVSGPALQKHIPTNDWWSSLIINNHVSNLFNYPMALKTVNQGLVTSYIPWGVYDDQEPIINGVTGLNAPKAKVYDFSDWTVTLEWASGNHSFKAISGIGMPFTYFTKEPNDIAQVVVNLGSVIVSNEIIMITDARNGADFIVFAPEGSVWMQNGNTFTSSLNNKNYWSMAMIPQSVNDVASIAEQYQKYAYVFPQNTITSWEYDQVTSTVKTNFIVDVDIKEGQYENVLLGLLPHQWSNLSFDSIGPDEFSYNSVRGELKTLNGNSFTVENYFSGILPTLPYLSIYSPGYDPSELSSKIAQIENDELASWTDSYNEGQVMNRLVQTARIADEIGDIESRDKMINTVKNRLEDWLTASNSEVAFLFYYNNTWSTLIGYPAGHGQDTNLNDHHFHWGYFIHAASFIEQYQPGWANDWGDMINHLVRDAASPNREDPKYPFLRSFSPYAGHCWANGFASFPQGNDQESSSESMQFNSSLIHWGSITGDDEIRDLGIYLYTTEQTAIEEYWFDIENRNFASSHPYSLVSRVWGNSYDNGTFWTSDIAASYGIEMYPIHGGSLYLGHNIEYSQTLWNEIENNTGILSNQTNPNLWHDVMWKYLSFINPQAAIDLYNSYPNRELKFGISDAQTYYWLHSMNALGEVQKTVYADHPIAASFNKNGLITYVAHNYSSNPITVNYTDGYQLEVPANQLITSRTTAINGVISSSFNQAYIDGSIQLNVDVENNQISKVEFYDGSSLVGEDITSPYEFQLNGLSAGMHNVYGKIYIGTNFGLTNVINIQVGEQVPFSGNPIQLPGVINVADFDSFEGGLGQNISYFDVSQSNQGGYRPEEYVDLENNGNEGTTLGWTVSGEWIEYNISVETAGNYNVLLRCASGNPSGGGPFYFEINGERISDNMVINNTGDWYNWVNKTLTGVELNKGEHILRLVILGGEFNLGSMTFSYDSPLNYIPPVSNAGDNIIVISPHTSTVLDGSMSYDQNSSSLNYLWNQVYGPTIALSDNFNLSNPAITNLSNGYYKFKLTVDDGVYSSNDYTFIIVSETSNIAPIVSFNSPIINSSFYYGSDIELIASANDLDGDIMLVEFYNFETKIGEDGTPPYSYVWSGASIGNHEIQAKATDNENLSSYSSVLNLEITEAPLCTGGPDNGDYTYQFSEDSENPTITFIPSANHVGSPTCILYYSSSGTPPGYNISPNMPYQIYADGGETIHFYFTYSFNGLEKNTAADQHSYVIGSCNTEILYNQNELLPDKFSFNIYPNPFNPSTNIDYSILEDGNVDIIIHDLLGRNIKNLYSGYKKSGFWKIKWDSKNDFGNSVSAGVYLCSIKTNNMYKVKKIILLK